LEEILCEKYITELGSVTWRDHCTIKYVIYGSQIHTTVSSTITEVTRVLPVNDETVARIQKRKNSSVAVALEFLTEETTCATILSKKTPYEKIYQKRPLLGGGMSGQATCVTCRLGQSRHAPAATPKAGKLA
jgi:hypothetical protein